MPWLASMQSLRKPAIYLGLSLMLVLVSMIKPNPIRVDLHLGRLTGLRYTMYIANTHAIVWVS